MSVTQDASSGTNDDKPNNRLVEILLDDKTIGRATPDIEHERDIAIYDLLEENQFALPDKAGGPYKLQLSIVDNRLIFDITVHATDSDNTDSGDTDSGNVDETTTTHILSLRPFRRIVKDYYLICESYFSAIKNAPPSQIEAIDMGRRGLHDEGSHILLERLDGKIETNFETARRLFTLICVLHWRGS